MTIAVIPRESKKNSSERGCSFFLPLNYTKSLFCIISGVGNYVAPLLR